MKENTVCLSLDTYIKLILENQEMKKDNKKYKELYLEKSRKYNKIRNEYKHLIGIINIYDSEHLKSWNIDTDKICDYYNNNIDKINML